MSSPDTGNDHDECVILNRKCGEFEQEIEVESQRFEGLTTLANKLASIDPTGVGNVCERKQTLKRRWEELKDQTVERKRNLANVLQLFSFLKSCDELLDNINEKVWYSLILILNRFLN